MKLLRPVAVPGYGQINAAEAVDPELVRLADGVAVVLQAQHVGADAAADERMPLAALPVVDHVEADAHLAQAVVDLAVERFDRCVRFFRGMKIRDDPPAELHLHLHRIFGA